jgi:hypothetical protein
MDLTSYSPEMLKELLDSDMDSFDRKQLLAIIEALTPEWEPLDGPQRMAYESEADIIGYGGAAGGGKTDLICGMALTKHKRSLIVRREKAQTEGIIQRITEIRETTDGFNSQKAIWKIDSQRLMEFAGLDNPGDERRWQGRPHDLKCFDEVTEQREAQVRFVMGWLRSPDPSIKCKVLMTFNPPTTTEGRWVLDYYAPWLTKNHPRPAKPGELRWFTTEDGKDVEVPDNRPYVRYNGQREYDFDPLEHKEEDIIRPKSRTFIPARVTDNPFYMTSGYMSTLQALPEPLRSQMLNGDFLAGIEDDIWQLLPTRWVEDAQKRWKDRYPKPPMDSLGCDVARGGKDNSLWVARHGMWFDKPVKVAGKDTPDGPEVAGRTVALVRDGAPIHIDVIGVGASPYDFLNKAKQHVIPVDVRKSVTAKDQSGALDFFNLRTCIAWQFREALDPANNTGIEIPPGEDILRELCSIQWSISGRTIKVESREDIIKRLGYSPDTASGFFLANIHTPKLHEYRPTAKKVAERNSYDPYENLAAVSRGEYDPYKNM